MTASVLLDTSFLITLVDRNRPNHRVASQYYRYMLEYEIPMYFSAIAASEFEIKQPITELPLKNFRSLPFNMPHARVAARFWNALSRSRESNTPRHVARDDIKLIAQASHEVIGHILTEDRASLYRYCVRLREFEHCDVHAVVLADGFDDCAFRSDGQRGLGLSNVPESGHE